MNYKSSKFLVKGEAWRGLAEPVRIRQGYVATKDGTTVRVRVILRYKALVGGTLEFELHA